LRRENRLQGETDKNGGLNRHFYILHLTHFANWLKFVIIIYKLVIYILKMAKLLDQIIQELKKAQKEQNKEKLSTLRMLVSAIKNEEIAKKKRGKLSDEEIQEVITREVRKHKDSIESYKAGGRSDLVKKEEAELEILKQYLPKQLSLEELTNIIDEVIKISGATSPADFGKVMGQVMKRVKGKAEGSSVSKMVKEKLVSK